LYEPTIETLGTIGPDSAEAVPLLVDFVKGDDPVRALAAAVAVARILPPDGEALQDAIPVLVKSLKNNSGALRGDAIRALGLIGPQALPPLIALVEKHAADSDAAWNAEVAMEWMGNKAEPAIPALVAALESQKEKVALHAAAALGAIGPPAKDAAPALRKSLASKISRVRAYSASALGDIGVDDEATVAVLATALKDPDEYVRRESAEALGKLGPAARAAVPVLIATLDDAIGSVTMHAAQALAGIGPDAVPELIPVVKRDDRIRHLAVLILGELGPAARPAVGVLTSVLSSDDQDFVREAILALSRIGPDAKPAVPGLMKILGDQKR
jgi:HEAT repeat protein